MSGYRGPTDEDIEFMIERRGRLACNRLQCCMSKSGFIDAANSTLIACWCYHRDENGNNATYNCVERILVVDPNGVGDARYTIKEGTRPAPDPSLLLTP